MPSRAAEKPPGRPTLFKTLLELRAGGEYVGGICSHPLRQWFPRGDGHPVVVVPAFMGGALTTRRLRDLLNDLGYEAFDWKLGRNMGPVGTTEKLLLQRVQQIQERLGRKPSLIGWSLGGVYTRVLAHSHPELLRSVITLGSPLHHPHQSAVDGLYHHISGQFERPDYLAGIDAPPDIPATAIYSRLDGIVNWRACLSQESDTSENIRVFGSHCGLGFNPLVHWIIADRLAQPEGKWKRFSWSRSARS